MNIQPNRPPHPHSAAVRAGDGFLADHQPSTKLSVVRGFTVAIDFIAVAASTYFGSALYHDFSLKTPPHLTTYVWAAFFIAGLFTLVSLGFHHFDMAHRRQLHTLLWSSIGAVIFSFAIFLSTIFLLKISATYSRGAFIFDIVGVSTSVCIVRTIWFWRLQSAVASGIIEARRAILIGDIDLNISRELRAEGIRVVDSFPFPRESGNAGETRILASNISMRSAMELCRVTLPDEVLIFAGQEDLVFASNLAQYFSALPCNIHIAPLNDVKFLTRAQIADWGTVKTLQVARRPLSNFDHAIKRIFDAVVASVALVGLSPLLFIIAVAIKLDSRGKILFRQN